MLKMTLKAPTAVDCPSWGNYLCMSVRLFPGTTWISGWWWSRAPMFYQHLMVLTTGFPGAPPHPRPCTPNVYIPHAPLPTLSLSNLQRHHAPTPPITTCWCCSCSP